MRKVIAIDFDGCLCENRYPEIGPPCWRVINAAKQRQKEGWALVLWTCREGESLDAAITACTVWGLSFDGINEQLPEWRDAYQNDTRKIGATEYWDDKAVFMPAAAQYDQTWAAIRFLTNELQANPEQQHPVACACLEALYEKARRDSYKGTVFYSVTRNKWELADFISGLLPHEHLVQSTTEETRQEIAQRVCKKLSEEA